VALGHRRIAFLCEAEEMVTPDCEARREGYRMQMARHGLPVTNGDELYWSWELNEFDSWWKSGPPATAILCWSERCAATVLERAKQLGVSVPASLSVVGFDSTQYCDLLSPKLTSVRQPITEMARLSAEMMLRMIQGEKLEASSFVLPCDFDVRESTAPPRT
jgi:DNA-binding LacI/PurR family transcriptional regulator